MLSEYDDGMQSAAPGMGQRHQLPVPSQEPHRPRTGRRGHGTTFDLVGANGVPVADPDQAPVGHLDGWQVGQGVGWGQQPSGYPRAKGLDGLQWQRLREVERVAPGSAER